MPAIIFFLLFDLWCIFLSSNAILIHPHYSDFSLLLTNTYTHQICFGLYVPLIFISLLKQSIKQTPERKKKLSFKIWTICASLTPFAAIIIGEFISRNHLWFPLHSLFIYLLLHPLFVSKSNITLSQLHYLFIFLFLLFAFQGAHIAYRIKSQPDQSYYAKNLKIVGK